MFSSSLISLDFPSFFSSLHFSLRLFLLSFATAFHYFFFMLPLLFHFSMLFRLFRRYFRRFRRCSNAAYFILRLMPMPTLFAALSD